MIAYVDTSAVVPLVVIEDSTVTCQRLWEQAEAIVSSRLLYVEGAAALARARRTGRLSSLGHRRARTEFEGLWDRLDVIELDEPIVMRAADLTDQLGLRGYDAVHCASAEFAADGDMVAATGDRQLLDGWRKLGIGTVDVNVPDGE